MSEERPGVVVTIREMYDSMQELRGVVNDLTNTVKTDIESRNRHDLEGRVRKIEQQNAAHWVVHTIFLGVIGFALERLLS